MFLQHCGLTCATVKPKTTPARGSRVFFFTGAGATDYATVERVESTLDVRALFEGAEGSPATNCPGSLFQDTPILHLKTDQGRLISLP
jgi:hypothetical protein